MNVRYPEKQPGHGRWQRDPDVTRGSQIEESIELVAHLDALIGWLVLHP